MEFEGRMSCARNIFVSFTILTEETRREEEKLIISTPLTQRAWNVAWLATCCAVNATRESVVNFIMTKLISGGNNEQGMKFRGGILRELARSICKAWHGFSRSPHGLKIIAPDNINNGP